MSNDWNNINEEFALEQFHEFEEMEKALLPAIKKWLYENKDKVFDQLELGFCDYCEDFVGVEMDVVNGKVGHIDNWVPDEHLLCCDRCGRSIE